MGLIQMPPEVSTYIQSEITALTPDKFKSWPSYDFKHNHNALVLHYDADYLWAITPKGTILCRDLLALDGLEEETNAVQIREVLENGAQNHPILQVLLLPFSSSTSSTDF
ncbi:MAG: hypothetical protein J0L94_05450 [Rhodothermia bacterium]|nr:hypothetical protein [Rhodothermia bacterium]